MLMRILVVLLAFAAAIPAQGRTVAPPADRWVEVDLYWFDSADVERSADTLWTRYAPLYHGVTGYKGIVLSIGTTPNFILSFDGDPDQLVALPDTSGQEVGFPIAGPLEGDTAQRQKGWRQRFTGPAPEPQTIAYGRWSYRTLRQLTDALRARASRDGVRDFRVAAFAVGGDSAYGDTMPFAKRHPEAFTH